MLFERVLGFHVGIAVLTLIRFVVGMCLYMALEFRFGGEGLVMCAFASRPEAAEAIRGVLIKAINVVFVNMGMKGSRRWKV